jgi:hypothetical protein
MPSHIKEDAGRLMRKSALTLVITASAMALASALFSTTRADGETKTPASVILEHANWAKARPLLPGPSSAAHR